MYDLAKNKLHYFLPLLQNGMKVLKRTWRMELSRVRFRVPEILASNG